MPFEGFDVVSATNLIAIKIDFATCFQCCKFYRAPARAPCGHALCNLCWKGRRTCPTCAAPIQRKELKLDSTLNYITKHVQGVAQNIGQLFGLSMSDYAVEVDKGQDSDKDPSNNVKAWLASSENHFSAPLTDTQHSTMDILPPKQLKVQIHLEPHTTENLEKIAHIRTPQDDWDKIDTMSDTEEICAKNKDKVLGPMDLEPLYPEEDEFTEENPRRSSRKTKSRNNVNNSVSKAVSENQTINNSVPNVDKKLEKAKQNWTNVKRMKKEFNKLNKINKSKLNVSIEMCKKTSSCKPHSEIVPAGKVVEEIVIEDNTPDAYGNATKIYKDVINSVDAETLHCSESVLREPVNQKESAKRSDSQEHMKVDEGITDKANKKTSEMATQTSDENRNPEIRNVHLSTDPQNKKTPTISVPLHSTFQRNNITEEQKCSENEKPAVVSSSNPDDIFITVRVGDVVTSFTISKTQDDVQMKVSTDKAVQTTLSQEKSTFSKEVQTTTQVSSKLSQNSSRNLKKSGYTKKNTASADTVTAPYVIMESVEKELSNVMECEEINNPNDELCNTLAKNADMEEDIFNSGSVKELISAKSHAPSEILIPTRTQRTNRHKTQKCDKRERDSDSIIEDTANKRKKLTQDKIDEELPEPDHQHNKPLTLPQESLNYDDVMSQVFANIDADITGGKKINENKARITQKDLSQLITQKKPHLCTKKTHVEGSLQKESENMFSTVGNVVEKGHTTIAGPETQLHIAKLLTPRMCEELAATAPGPAGEETVCPAGEEPVCPAGEELVCPAGEELVCPAGEELVCPAGEELVCPAVEELVCPAVEELVCTPAMDDIEDVVEATPQKETSITKARSDLTNRSSAMTKPKADEQKTAVAIAKGKTLDSQDIGSIINLTDTTVRESSCPNAKEPERRKDRSNLETPLTMNKFFDDIIYNSTPMPRKSLNFSKPDDEDITLCPDTTLVAKTTQEKEFMAEAFEKTTPVRKPLLAKTVMRVKPTAKRFCIAGSCLTGVQDKSLKMLCARQQWTFVDKYVPELTHLVVTVDQDGKAQRSVKYMCALAAGKWIVSPKWVEKCLETNSAVKEEPFEALDSMGEAGPRRSRTSAHQLFRGITFYCLPPFSVLDVDTLANMLRAAGGTVVEAPEQVRVDGNGRAPALVLAEPEHTQEDRFTYMAMQLGVVPVNCEWALNCLGSYCLHTVYDLLLCPPSLLPQATANWPQALLASPEDSMD